MEEPGLETENQVCPLKNVEAGAGGRELSVLRPSRECKHRR